MNFKILFATLALVIATNVQAQAQALSDSAASARIAIGFNADIGNLFEKGAVPAYTDKYNGCQSAKIFFNAGIAKLTVYKGPNDCNANSVCTMLSAAPLEVYFEIKKVERIGCYDSYYAKTPDNVKSDILERVIIQRFASERCQSLMSAPEGSIDYQITGVNSKTGELGSAEVFSKLTNVKLVRIDQ